MEEFNKAYEVHEEHTGVFAPSIVQCAEFEVLRAGFYAERQHNRLLAFKSAALSALVGGAVTYLVALLLS